MVSAVESTSGLLDAIQLADAIRAHGGRSSPLAAARRAGWVGVGAAVGATGAPTARASLAEAGNHTEDDQLEITGGADERFGEGLPGVIEKLHQIALTMRPELA